MNGIKFDFDNGDLALNDNGAFTKANVDSQCAALIALSQVCRITQPQVGAQIGARTVNRHRVLVPAIISEARRMVEKDGGKDVLLKLDENDKLLVSANYDN